MIKILSSYNGNYFVALKKKEHISTKIDVIIDDKVTYQTLLGFGGALTEAAYFNYSCLSEVQKEEFINSVFGKEGLNYNLIRITIGSCDFSCSTYDYLESGEFLLKHDIDTIIPFIKKGKAIKDLMVFASPWSPPAIYKTNGIRQHGGKLKLDCYTNYASYLINYLKSMKDNGVKIDFMSIQNEPKAVQIWDSCIYEGEEEGKLVKVLYPLLLKNDLSTKLFIWDHNKDIIVDRVKETIDEENNDYIYGIAYHWYDNFCNQELSKVHDLYSDKVLLFTEGCVELLLLDQDNPSKNIGSFENGLRYAKNYILDSENFSSGFIDWNLLLDENGGPNYVGNFCEAPIMFNHKEKKLIYNPSYYIISHFSRFLEKGDVRINTKVINTFVIATTYKKVDNTYINILLNQGDKTTITIKFIDEVFSVNLEANSVTTIIYKK